MSSALAVRERRLSNGLLVLALERRANPVVTSMIWYRVGSRDEQTGETGLSHFLEHMMFKGTQRLAKGEVDLITAKLGGSNNAFTDHDYTAYYFSFARDRWETAFAIEAERMRGCALDPAEFESEKKVVLEELRMGKDDPWRDLHEAMGPTAFHVHPYRHPVIGWQSDLERLDRETMVSFYKRHYSPDHAVIVVCGDVKAADVFEAAERYFGKIPASQSPREAVLPEPPQRGERRVQVVRDTPMRRMLAAFHGTTCGTSDDYALDVLTSILASGRASRLYMSLVKKQRLATHVSVENEARLDPGMLWFWVEARDGVKESDVERALFAEIEKVRTKPVTAAELARAKKLIVASQSISMESAYELADRIGRAEVLCRWRYVPEYLKKLQKVTARDVLGVAQRLLEEKGRVVGWSLPERAASVTSQKAAPPAKSARRAGRRLSAPAVVVRSNFPIPPRRGPAPAVKLPFLREVLPNGLVVLATRNSAAPTVSLMAHVEVGLLCEPEAKAGVEHFTGSLLDEGTRRWTGDEIAQAIEEAGGFFGSGSGGVSCSVLEESFPLALELTASVLREPTFPKEAVGRVRDEILSDLVADEDDLRTRAFRALREEVYGLHPLHRPSEGYVKTVRKLGREDVAAFHKKWYSPGRTILSISGDLDPREAVKRVAKEFGSWRAPLVGAPAPPQIPLPAPKRIVQVVDREQVHLAIGHLGIRRRDPRYMALLVLDHVLGTGPGFTDRISKKLRDEEGLAYHVRANVTSTAGMEPGIFSAYLSTEPKNAEHACAGLLREIRRAQTEPPTESEVRMAKDYLIGSFPFSVERNTGRAHTMIQMERHHLGADYLERFPELIEEVTKEDVAKVAREFLRPEDCVIVRVGPKR